MFSGKKKEDQTKTSGKPGTTIVDKSTINSKGNLAQDSGNTARSIQQRPSIKLNNQDVVQDANAQSSGRLISEQGNSDRKAMIDYGNPTLTEPIGQSGNPTKGSDKLSKIALRDYYDQFLVLAITKGLEEVGKTRPNDPIKFLGQFLKEKYPNQ